MPLPPPDAILKAFSSIALPFNMEIGGSFWCINKKPAATIFMTAFAPNFQTGKTEHWTISTPGITTNNATEVDTEKELLGNEVTAFLKNVTVKNDTTGKTFTKCVAFLDADSVRLPGGTGAVNFTLVVKRHPTDVKPVFTWVQLLTGTVEVRREVSCEL